MNSITCPALRYCTASGVHIQGVSFGVTMYLHSKTTSIKIIVFSDWVCCSCGSKVSLFRRDIPLLSILHNYADVSEEPI
jgi:hypothetical protein